MRSLFPLIAFAALLLSSCDDGSTSSRDDSPYPAHRDISSTLRAKCPDMTPAGRIAGETTGTPVVAEQNQASHITYGIYDSTGTLVTVGERDLPSSGSAYATNIGWNGTDAAGNKVPTGVYFVFVDVYDPEGNFLQSSSYCIGVRSSSST